MSELNNDCDCLSISLHGKWFCIDKINNHQYIHTYVCMYGQAYLSETSLKFPVNKGRDIRQTGNETFISQPKIFILLELVALLRERNTKCPK